MGLFVSICGCILALACGIIAAMLEVLFEELHMVLVEARLQTVRVSTLIFRITNANKAIIILCEA